MILLNRDDNNKDEFEKLLDAAIFLLIKDAKSNVSSYKNATPNQMENKVYDALVKASRNTSFENTIRLVSGKSFPDIVSKVFGVEVKTSHNNWKSTANSVLESTRVENIEFIYIFFVKITDSIDFIYRPYQSCIYDIAVTHSPRYLIDMMLKPGETIFDKMKIDYNQLRISNSPISHFIDYYRSICKPGEEPWWMDGGESEENIVHPTVQTWNKLPSEEKDTIRIELIARFPKLFSNNANKYAGPAAYLVAKYGVVNSSLRDLFSAGGQVNLHLGNVAFLKLPQVYRYLHRDYQEIVEEVTNISPSEAAFYWQLPSLPKKSELLFIWKELVIQASDPAEEPFLVSLFYPYDEENL